MPAAPSISITQSSPSIPPGTSLQAAHNPPLQPAPQARLGGTFWGRDSPLEPLPALWGQPPAPGFPAPPSFPPHHRPVPARRLRARFSARRPAAPAGAGGRKEPSPRARGSARLRGELGEGKGKGKGKEGKGEAAGLPAPPAPRAPRPGQVRGAAAEPAPGAALGTRREEEEEKGEEPREGGEQRGRG